MKITGVNTPQLTRTTTLAPISPALTSLPAVTCEVRVVRGVDEVVRQRLVHVVDDVQPLRGYDAVLLAPQVASECLQTDLVWRGRGRGGLL